METAINTQKLRMALATIRKDYVDSIERSMVNESGKNFEQFASEHGVRRQFVSRTAAKHGVGSRAFLDAEVSNG